MNAVPYREAARQLLRKTLLEAAASLLEQRPWAQITMADIANRAGVSRQTLYNELGSREQFAQAFVLREAQRFIETVREAIEAHLDDPTAALTAALQLFLDTAGRDPLIATLLDDDGTGGMLPLITTRGRPVLDWAGSQIAQAISEGWPAVLPQDALLLAQTLVRLAISYLTMPTLPPQQATQEAVRLLAPFIEQAVTAGEIVTPAAQSARP
jgi:AcrR family transcriptional regulator